MDPMEVYKSKEYIELQTGYQNRCNEFTNLLGRAFKLLDLPYNGFLDDAANTLDTEEDKRND